MRLLLFFVFFLLCANAFAQLPKRQPGTQGTGTQGPFDRPTDTIGGRQDSVALAIEQNTDTINFVKVVREYNLNIERKEPKFSLDDVHMYQPVMQSEEPTVNYGNNGLPIRQLTFSPNYYQGINLGRNSLDSYKIQNDSVKYYQTQRPFTKLFYATGSARENRFKLAHSQNWGRGLNVGFDYNRLVSDGFYDNQEIDHNNIAVHTWFRSKNKKLNVMAHHVSNKYTLGANGGNVPGENYYINEDFNNRVSIPVNLTDTEKLFNGKNYQIQTSYDLGKTVDVEINDSISDTQLIPRFRIQNTFRFQRARDRLADPTVDVNDRNYFDNIAEQASEIADTIAQETVFTEFRLKWLGNKLSEDSLLIPQNFLADVYLNFSRVNIDMTTADIVIPPFLPVTIGHSNEITDLVAGGSFRSNPLDSAGIIYKAEGEFHFADVRQGDFYLHGEAGFDLNTAGRLVGFVELINQEQIYTANRLEQTVYSINNSLDKLNARTIGGEYYNPFLDATLKARFTNATNVLYWDENKNPTISGDAESYLLLNVNKHVQYKRFHANASVFYQTSSNNRAIGRPDWLASGDVFFKGPLFKNKVIGKMGLNATYMSKFYLDDYDPALDQFFIQRDIEYENNPQIGFFTNFQLSRARVFARLDNLTAFAFDRPIFHGHHYAQHDFAFRAGINWVFVN